MYYFANAGNVMFYTRIMRIPKSYSQLTCWFCRGQCKRAVKPDIAKMLPSTLKMGNYCDELHPSLSVNAWPKINEVILIDFENDLLNFSSENNTMSNKNKGGYKGRFWKLFVKLFIWKQYNGDLKRKLDWPFKPCVLEPCCVQKLWKYKLINYGNVWGRTSDVHVRASHVNT